jgi:hypothetical protein
MHSTRVEDLLLNEYCLPSISIWVVRVDPLVWQPGKGISLKSQREDLPLVQINQR